MNEEHLRLIAEALEGIDKNLQNVLPDINTSLTDIAERLEQMNETLNGCISCVGNNNFLCITGNISTN